MYLPEFGVAQDFKEAHGWSIKAAEQNFAMTHFYLEELYFDGDAVKQK